jgi:hypothetical protein
VRRGDKIIGIILTYKNWIREEFAQCVVGCEILAERHNLGTVYGIATNFVQWSLVRCSGDKLDTFWLLKIMVGSAIH